MCVSSAALFQCQARVKNPVGETGRTSRAIVQVWMRLIGKAMRDEKCGDRAGEAKNELQGPDQRLSRNRFL